METVDALSGDTIQPPRYTFCLDQPARIITPRDPQWGQFLPTARPETPPAEEGRPGRRTITYGDYFQSVKAFLSSTLIDILQGLTAPRRWKTIDGVIIHLVKHGALYHPAKVTIQKASTRVCFVVNVAVSETGRRIIRDEAANLERLFHGPLQSLVPKVLAVGEGKSESRSPLPMFAARWLDGFAEFHVSGDRNAGGRQIWKVWDENGDWDLTFDHLQSLRRQAASILSCAYSPLTFETILDWHHAAGDFIVRRQGTGVDVRLVSVRRYAPLIHVDRKATINLDDILEGLLLFLLDLTLRMRLDRHDGVGRLVWASDDAVPAAWEGVIQGLRSACGFHNLPLEVVHGMIHYAAAHSMDDWAAMGRRIVDRMNRLVEERDLVAKNLPAHVRALKRVIDIAAKQRDPY